MAKCWNCGADMPDGTRYCPVCGKDQTFNPPSSGSGRFMGRGRGSRRQEDDHFGSGTGSRISRLEKRVDTIHKMAIGVLVLQLVFLVLLFAVTFA